MKTYVNGTVAVIEGPKFDLDRVIRAHDRVIDALVERFGPALLGCDVGDGYARYDWPGEGPAKSRLFWEGMARDYDANPLPLIILQPQLTVQVRLLGMTWCVQDAVTDALKLHDGSAIDRLNPVPTISVFGAWDNGSKQFGLVPDAVTEAVAELAAGSLADLQLEFLRTDKATAAAMKAGAVDACRFRFPHAVYGKGRGPLMVRCWSSDGGEPDATNLLTPFMEN